jgi:hypothetical protein
MSADPDVVVDYLTAQDPVTQAEAVAGRVMFRVEDGSDGISLGTLLEEYGWAVYFHDYDRLRWWAMPIEEVTG